MSEYIKVCEETTRAAGGLILEKMGRVAVREKGRHDLVTEADVAAQDLVRTRLQEAFPGHSLLGEEDGPPAARGGPSEFRWIVDPIDGTTNYAHQVPYFCVSLALERMGELLVGAIYDPVAEECYTAAAGEGAFLNGRPIHASGTTRLSDALATVGFPAVPSPDSPDVRLFLRALGRCQALRRMGSVALNLAYLAAGRFDASWSFCTNAWDIAAGALLVREAGGTITSPGGEGLSVDGGIFVAAATAELHAEVRALMKQAELAL
jgi:myo-inositol-1(or 4)-monophosphatase